MVIKNSECQCQNILDLELKLISQEGPENSYYLMGGHFVFLSVWPTAEQLLVLFGLFFPLLLFLSEPSLAILRKKAACMNLKVTYVL